MKCDPKLHYLRYSLPDHKTLDSSKLKEFADNNFKFDKSGRKLSKWVENTAGKGEIAHNEQFLLFPQCFQKANFPGASKGVIVWEWFNSLPNDKILDWSKLKAFADDKLKVATIMIFVLDSVENIVGKGENAAFSPFLTMFSNGFFLRVVKSKDCVVKCKGRRPLMEITIFRL